MKWITRARPKIDRIACPWLILRFIDKDAQFLYVPADQVLSEAARTGAIPYDVPDVELTHVEDRCSFDAFVAKYGLSSVPMDQLATMIRGADTGRLDLAPQSAGLYAVSLGLSQLLPDDHAMLEQGLVIYDALYAWCAQCQEEKHSWPPQPPASMYSTWVQAN